MAVSAQADMAVSAQAAHSERGSGMESTQSLGRVEALWGWGGLSSENKLATPPAAKYQLQKENV